MGKICILGSINMDLVLGVKDIPKPGETILGTSYNKFPGGKGANQAVASARLGNHVSFIGKVGQDENGTTLVQTLKKEGINIDNIVYDKSNPTGTALITVSSLGENSIVVISGSNMEITESEIFKAEDVIKSSDICITQFETPQEAAIEAFKIAKNSGSITILNPAPANCVSNELLQLTDIIVPNETEAFELSGIKVEDLDSAKASADIFIKKGVKTVIITMGEKGAAVISHNDEVLIPAYKVNAVDTTAAGDAFIGALAGSLSHNKDLSFESIKKAVLFANKVSSIVVQRAGAQPSIPFLKEIEI
jgi:ribokinase